MFSRNLRSGMILYWMRRVHLICLIDDGPATYLMFFRDFVYENRKSLNIFMALKLFRTRKHVVFHVSCRVYIACVSILQTSGAQPGGREILIEDGRQ